MCLQVDNVVAAVGRIGLLRVAGRVRIMAGRDGVGVADPAVATVDADFAAAGIMDDLAGSVDGALLGGGMRGGVGRSPA